MVNGIFLIDKEAGMTSRRVDNLIGKRFQTHSVGHLGTLDPFATGLLIVAINKGTKLLQYIEDGDKEYEATLALGSKTETGDPEGKVILEKEVPEISEATLQECLASFVGKSEQTPPKYSAIKVNGVPLYKSARAGEEVELKPRQIEIYGIEGTISGNTIKFTAKVSKGTYIRVLGEDIAEKLGTVGHLIALRRTKVGNIDVKSAKHIDDIEDEDILSGSELLTLPRITASEKMEFQAVNGQKLIIDTMYDKVLLVKGDTLIAVLKRKEGKAFVTERGLF